MERENKLIVAITIIAAIGILAVLWGTFLGGPNLSEGEKSILVLAVDESEPRPGMGAVDMAFLVELKDGSIKKYTPIYPGGMRHPTVAGPAEAQSAGDKLLLHDSLWDSDTQKGMHYAKEIIEANTNMNPDAVVAVNIEGLDTVISSAGQHKINGTPVNMSAIDIIRESDELYGGSMSRGDAVMNLATALSTAANNEKIRNTMVQTALDQYAKGNIIMLPEGSFAGLMASKGLGSLF